MQVLLVSVGTYGNTLPFLGLGKALRARGHDVTLLGSGYCEGPAKRAGLVFVDLDDPEEDRDLGASGTLPARGAGLFRLLGERALRYTPRVFRLLEERCAAGRSVVVAPAWLFGARLAAEKFGVPQATVFLQPLLLGAPPGLPTWRRWLRQLVKGMISRSFQRRLAPNLNAFRAEIGLPSLTRNVWDWALSPELILGFFPEWYSAPQADWPAQTRLVGFPLHDALDEPNSAMAPIHEYCAAGESLLVFSQASQVSDARRYFAVSVEVAHRLGRRAVFLTAHRQQIPAVLPAEVRLFEFAPLSVLLPRSAAIVHHGGMGTIAQALAAGVPQLTVPGLLDQFDNSRRLLALGVSANLSARFYRPGKAVRLLRQVLDSPETARNCRGYAARCREETPFARACVELEQLHQRGASG